MPIIFLIGFMGSGKTTFGKKLAAKLKADFIDLDHLLVVKEGAGSIKEIIEAKGMDYFRKAESDLLKSLDYTNAVVSTGGGTPCYFDNISWIKSRGVVVFLQLDEGVIFSRLKTTDLEDRPLLKGKSDDELKAFIHATLAERLPYYQQAHIVFNSMKDDVTDLVQMLMPGK